MAEPHPGPSHDLDPLWREARPPVETMVELRALLAERGDLESLRELTEGDRLRMLSRSEAWMAKSCYLLDYRSLCYDALTLVVAAGPTIEGGEDMTAWLEGTIDVAARGLLDRDVEQLRAGVPAEEPFERRFAFLMEALQFTPSNVRTATVAANGLRAVERHVFYHCFVLGKGFGRYEDEFETDALQARDLLMRAIDVLSDAVGDEE